MSESQPDTEVAECSGSKCDFSFRKLKSGVRKRYYRNKNSSEADEEVGETSGTRKSNADDKGRNSFSFSYFSNILRADRDLENLELSLNLFNFVKFEIILIFITKP